MDSRSTEPGGSLKFGLSCGVPGACAATLHGTALGGKARPGGSSRYHPAPEGGFASPILPRDSFFAAARNEIAIGCAISAGPAFFQGESGIPSRRMLFPANRPGSHAPPRDCVFARGAEGPDRCSGLLQPTSRAPWSGAARRNVGPRGPVDRRAPAHTLAPASIRADPRWLHCRDEEEPHEESERRAGQCPGPGRGRSRRSLVDTQRAPARAQTVREAFCAIRGSAAFLPMNEQVNGRFGILGRIDPQLARHSPLQGAAGVAGEARLADRAFSFSSRSRARGRRAVLERSSSGPWSDVRERRPPCLPRTFPLRHRRTSRHHLRSGSRARRAAADRA